MKKFNTNEIREIKSLIDDLEIYIQRSVCGLSLEDYTFKDGYISNTNIDNTRNELYKRLTILDNLLIRSYDDGK